MPHFGHFDSGMTDRIKRASKPKAINRSFLTNIDEMDLDELMEGAKVEGNFEGECIPFP